MTRDDHMEIGGDVTVGWSYGRSFKFDEKEMALPFAERRKLALDQCRDELLAEFDATVANARATLKTRLGGGA